MSGASRRTGLHRVVLADPLDAEGVAVLRADDRIVVEDCSRRGRERLHRSLAGAAGLIVRSATRVDEDLLAAGADLRVIGRAGVGLDNVDVDAATRRGIAVLNAPGGNTVSTAELTLALMLGAARRISSADRSVREGRWDRKSFQGAQLAGKALGVLGAGRIGTEVILRARAFGMKILVCDPYLSVDRATDMAIDLVDLDTLLARADFLTLHVPLTPETRGLLDARRLALMKPSAVVVNAARGGILDEDALAEALREGRLAGAALDVFETEPLPADSPLRTAPNVLVTPHLGAATPDAQREVSLEIAAAVRAALLEGDLRSAVNVPPTSAADPHGLQSVLALAERLGALLREVASGALTEVSVEYGGEIQRGLRLIASAALVGLLRDRVPGPLTVVNALLVARDMGIEVSRARLRGRGRYRDRLAIGARSAGETHGVSGVVEADGTLRLLGIDGYHMDVEPRGNLLVVRSDDVPGVIGEVGTRLGRAGVHVAEFHQVRDLGSHEALSVLATDEGLEDALLDELRGLPAVRLAREVRLGGAPPVSTSAGRDRPAGPTR